MFVTARSQVLAATDFPPRLTFYHQVNGLLTNVHELSFQVFDVSTDAKKLTPLQVFPALVGTKQPVNIVDAPESGGGKLGTGAYAAGWTVPADAALGEHKVVWSWKATSTSPLRSCSQPFDVLEKPVPLGEVYALPSSLRAEGVLSTGEEAVSDLRLATALLLSQEYVERVTRRFFTPRMMEVRVDGTGANAIMLNQPIIGVSSLKFAATFLLFAGLDQNPDAYRVYNRHLGGMIYPDDRNNPKLELYSLDGYASLYTSGGFRFPRGHQNVTLAGVFGYTEPDGSPFGKTPEGLQHAVRLLVLRNLPKLTDTDARRAQRDTWRITSEKTREQQIDYGLYVSKGSTVGSITGDPEIDSLLVMFRAPGSLGAV